jgi:Lipoxygenase
MTDEMAESRVEYPGTIYIPRDEEFEEKKLEMLADGDVKALLHNLVPLLVTSLSPETNDFKGFHDIDNLFKEGLHLKQALQDHLLEKIPFVTKILESGEGLLRYDTPLILRSKQGLSILHVVIVFMDAHYVVVLFSFAYACTVLVTHVSLWVLEFMQRTSLHG